jgi:NADH pyrophosphatase NudC (nudix superfamily)
VEIERAIHSIVEVPDYLEQPGDASSISRDQVGQIFGHGTYSDIDWQATGQTMAKVTISRHHWVSKHSSGFCGTSQMMLRWGKRATDLCPRCLREVEDATHAWQCQDSSALKVLTLSIAKLEVWMTKQRTQPRIIKAVCASNWPGK